MYIRCSSPFPQVESFVELCKERYALDLDAVEGGMKEGLASYIGSKRRTDGAPGIEAILVGTRRGDPHGGTSRFVVKIDVPSMLTPLPLAALLTPFDPTDSDWPRFMRVHPILDWSYKDIWDFLRHPELTLGDTKGIDWCEMYNYGFVVSSPPVTGADSGTGIRPSARRTTRSRTRCLRTTQEHWVAGALHGSCWTRPRSEPDGPFPTSCAGITLTFVVCVGRSPRLSRSRARRPLGVPRSTRRCVARTNFRS